MNLNFLCRHRKLENRYLVAFIEHYEKYLKLEIKDIVRCPDQWSKGKAPDYFLEELNIAVEVKRVINKALVSQLNSLDRSERRLQAMLDEVSGGRPDINEEVYLEYPFDLKIKRGKEAKLANQIISAICLKRRMPDGFRVIRKIRSSSLKIYLAGTGTAFWPLKRLENQLKHLVQNAIEQLKGFSSDKKILLLIDYFKVDLSNYSKAICSLNEILLKCKTIDEIWLQMIGSELKKDHYLLWPRNRELI